MRALHEALADGGGTPFIWDLAGDCVYEYRGSGDDEGWVPRGGFEELLARRPHADAKRLRRRLQAAARRTGRFQCESCITDSAGRHRWILERGRVRLDEDGRLREARGLAFEFTGRKRIEAALRSSELRLRTAFELSAAGQAELDPKSRRLLKVNGKLAVLTGHSREHLLRMTLDDLIHPDDRAAHRAAYDRAVAGGTSELGDRMRIQRTDGKVAWTEIRLRVLRDSGHRPVRCWAVVQDVTPSVKAAARLREMDRRKDEFLAELGHELRNPLSALKYGLQLLRTPGADPGDVRDMQEMMAEHLGQLERLAGDLLDVTRIARGELHLEKEHTDLAGVVRRAAQAAGSLLCQREHALTLDIQPPGLSLEADRTRLEQIMVNLLTNAARYTPPGGTVAVRARCKDRWVDIQVTDSGKGLSAGESACIFDPARRVRRESGGMGIGLALVRRLAELHGGAVAAASPGPGRGTTFTVRLPRGSTPAPPTQVRRQTGG